MILARDLIEPFIVFAAATYGVIIHRPNQSANTTDEIARFVLGERLYVIREFAELRGDAVEVFSSDRDGMQAMERLWYQVVQQTMEDSSGPTNGSE